MAILLFVAYLVAVIVAVFWVSPLIVGGILGGTCDFCFAALFVVNPLSDRLFEFILFSGLDFLIWFYGILGLLTGLYAYLVAFHGRNTLRALTLPLAKVYERLNSRSTLIIVGQVFIAILFFDFVYFTRILPAVGITVELPPSFRELPEWYLMYSLVEAAFTEEFAFRVVLVGLPLALGSLIVRLFKTSSLAPSGERRGGRYIAGSLKHIVGGQVNGSSPVATKVFGAVLVLLSATLFGLIHVLTWGVAWKFVDTFVGGLALGYVFLRKGIPASVLLHFSINAFSVLQTATGGEESLSSLVLIAIFYLALAALGSGFLAFYLREIGKVVFRPILKPSKRVLVGRPQPRQQTKAGETLFAVACPNCGSREAVYEEGGLKCSHCGGAL